MPQRPQDRCPKHIDYINRHKGGTRMYASNEENAAIIKSCGEPAALLYGFYLSKAHDSKYRFSDDKTARVFGWKVNKARIIRLKLEKAGWFAHTKTSGATIKVEVFFIGPVEVLAYMVEASKKKWSPADIAARLNALPLPYASEKKRTLLLRWISAGFVKMIAAEKTAYTENAYAFAATLLP
jgi:hypothetical protein